MASEDKTRGKKEIERDYEAFIKYVNLGRLPLVLTQFLEDLGRNPDTNENLIYRVVLTLCGQEVQESINQHEKMKSRIRLSYCTAWRTSEDDRVVSDVFASPGSNPDLAEYDGLLKLEESFHGDSVKTDTTGPFEYIKETDKPYLMIADKEKDLIHVLSKDNMIFSLSTHNLSRRPNGAMNKINFNIAFVQKVESLQRVVEATMGYPYSGFFFDSKGESLERDFYEDMYDSLCHYLSSLRASISLVNTLLLSQDLPELLRAQAVVALHIMQIGNLRHELVAPLTNIARCTYKILDESGRAVALNDFEANKLTETQENDQEPIFDLHVVEEQLADNDEGRTAYVSSLIDSIRFIRKSVSQATQKEQQSFLSKLKDQSAERLNLAHMISEIVTQIRPSLSARGIRIISLIPIECIEVRTKNVARLILSNLLLNAAKYGSANKDITIDGKVQEIDSDRVITFVISNETDKSISQDELITLMSGRRSRHLGQRGLFYSRFFTNYLRDGRLAVKCAENKFKAELSFKEES